jgi:hypothetical protein
VFIAKNKSKDYWFAYSVPVEANTKSSCCWNQKSNDGLNFEFCDLNQKLNGFGNNNNINISERNNIFVHIEDHQVSQILPVGEHCQVKADGIEIAWLEDIDELKSIEFLKSVAIKNPKEIASNSLYALALHENKKASEELFDIALMQKDEISNNAVFWLGEARSDGLKHLEILYNELPQGDIKKHINFALTQLDDHNGVKLLEEIALSDPNHQQRSDALFWLAELAPNKTKDIIFKLLNNKDETYEAEHLVFTLSRLTDGQGDKGLFEILTGKYSTKLKKKSLFWLSQSDNTETIDKLQKLL